MKQTIRPTHIYRHIPSGRECLLFEVNPPRVLGSWREALFVDTGEVVKVQNSGSYTHDSFRAIRQLW